MKKILTFAVISLAAVLTLSCNKNEIVASDAEGGLTLGVTVGQAMTKAAYTDEELLANSQINIYYDDFSGLVRSYKYSEAPSTIYLPVNSYRVDVIAGEAAKATPATASWEQKSYKGSKSFAIIAYQNTAVEVNAGVSNVVSKVNFNQTVTDNFNTGYTLTIGLDAADATKQLVYDSSKNDAEGYFLVDGLDEPELTWTFEGTLAKDGSSFTKSGSIPAVEAGHLYALNLNYTIKDGEVSFDLYVDYATTVIDDTIIFEPVSTGLSSSSIYEIWAGHATIHADVDETEFDNPDVIKFAYTSNGTDWTTVDATRTSEGVYEATLTGLAGATDYTYKLVIDGEDQGDPMTLTTEAAPALPNGSFEYISKVSGKDYYKFYDPSCSVAEGQTMWWGSGNGEGSEGVNGSASMGIVITKPDTAAPGCGTYSVLAQSGSTLGMLAAGNIFCGNFDGLVGTSGGKVNFGRPWTSRPTAVRLWAKYSAGKINIIKSQPAGYSLTTNDYDRAQIKVAIGTWSYKTYGGTKDSPVLVNTTDASTFVDFYTDPNTIANAELILYGDGKQQINNGEMTDVDNSEWRQITIPIDYHSTTAYPTHIVISCASSMFGDYFTGCDTAKLWLDNIELLYE